MNRQIVSITARSTPTVIFLALITMTGCNRHYEEKTILFICEHGSAKSIVAAAHFNRIAEKEGVSIRAISRGTHPDAAVPEKINQLLNSDGFGRHDAQPVQLTTIDLSTSDYIVAFNPLPDSYGKPENMEVWSIPSFEAGYPTARDSILYHIERMIKRIKTENLTENL